jgi:hypothetical protein
LKGWRREFQPEFFSTRGMSSGGCGLVAPISPKNKEMPVTNFEKTLKLPMPA